MYRVIYLGYSEKMLEALYKSRVFEIALAVGTQGRLSEKYYDTIHKYNINYIEYKNKQELLDNIDVMDSADLCIMYKYEFIIPKEVTEKHMIINFHGGDLNKNRGAHAVVWSILLQEAKTCLSCYRLSGGIDEGYLIDAYEVAISEDDNVFTLNEKLAKGIPRMLSSIESYLLGKKKPSLIKGGTYRRKIEKKDYTIDLQKDAIGSIKAKVLSQQTYEGAVVMLNGNEFRVKHFELSASDSAQDGERQLDIRKDYIDIHESYKNLRLYI